MKSRAEMLEEFVAADPADTFSRYALALELDKQQRAAEAITRLREVIGYDASYVAAYYHLGRLLAREGHDDEAREIYAAGLEVAAKAGERRTQEEIREALAALD